MLKLNLSIIFSARGVKNGYSFLKNIGIGHTAAHSLRMTDRKSVRLDHVEKICVALRCTPNDLLEWSPGRESLDAQHPLNSLMAREEELNLLSEIRQLPLEKFGELKEKLDELKE